MPVLREVPLKLVDVYKLKDAEAWLYALLGCRDPLVNISHRTMPTFAQHRRFVRSRPYAFWYVIVAGSKNAGAIYLTRNNEIGVHLGKNFQGFGIGPRAILTLMRKHPRKRFLANIAPLNMRSSSVFGQLGFKHIQNTYEHEPN